MAVCDINRIAVPDASLEYEDHTPVAAEIIGLSCEPGVRAKAPALRVRSG